MPSNRVECFFESVIYVSRILPHSTIENGLGMWIISDNLPKCVALNAVQIAEVLGNRVLKKG